MLYIFVYSCLLPFNPKIFFNFDAGYFFCFLSFSLHEARKKYEKLNILRKKTQSSFVWWQNNKSNIFSLKTCVGGEWKSMKIKSTTQNWLKENKKDLPRLDYWINKEWKGILKLGWILSENMEPKNQYKCISATISLFNIKTIHFMLLFLFWFVI